MFTLQQNNINRKTVYRSLSDQDFYYLSEYGFEDVTDGRNGQCTFELQTHGNDGRLHIFAINVGIESGKLSIACLVDSFSKEIKSGCHGNFNSIFEAILHLVGCFLKVR